ncbi:MAG: hypothetical protein HZA01_02365 [Nitrospinae bacterium]|nr:hypothetical protein [Nitrospinota bacterium]
MKADAMRLDMGEICLSELSLARFIDGLEDKEESEKIVRHLANCHECLDLFVSAKIFREERPEALAPSSPAKILKSIEKAIRGKKSFGMVLRFLEKGLELVETTGRVIMKGPARLEPVMVRDVNREKTSNLLSFSMEHAAMRLCLDIEKKGAAKSDLEIHLLSPSGKKQLNGVRITAFRDGFETASYVSEHGRVVFEDLFPGVYYFEIQKEGREEGSFCLSLIN